MSVEHRNSAVAFVGSYDDTGEGGIRAFTLSPTGELTHVLDHVSQPAEAGFLAFDSGTGVLYSVNERKSDGRVPIGAPAAVCAHSFDVTNGVLSLLSNSMVPGSFPSYLSIAAGAGLVFSTSHGALGEHAQVVRQDSEGGWSVECVYDDSTVVAWHVDAEGAISGIGDVQVLAGHGLDPNTSPQAGGHAQASAHAHCVVVDPSGTFAIVADKGTDQVIVYRIGVPLVEVSRFQMTPETGPRHVVFSHDGSLAYATCEFSSELASFAFDAESGRLSLMERISTTAPGFEGLNEPADLRLHPNGSFMYVNNRGEDSLAWYELDGRGGMRRLESAALAPSLHPGVAARSFAFVESGDYILLADRPANLVRTFRVDGVTGTATQTATTHVPSPAFVEIAYPSLGKSSPSLKEQA